LRIRLRKREFGDSGGKNEHWHVVLDAELPSISWFSGFSILTTFIVNKAIYVRSSAKRIPTDETGFSCDYCCCLNELLIFFIY